MANDPALPRDRIVYLVVEPSVAGKTALRFSLQPPALGEAQAAFRLRGKIMDGGLLDVDLVSNIDAMDLPAGPPGPAGKDGKDGTASVVPGPAGKDSTVPGPQGGAGANATNAQVAAAVAAYLAANPPAAGAAGKAGATGGQGTAGMPGATLLGIITLTDRATIALSAGVRNVSVSVVGLAVGDAVLLLPVALPPAGYAITSAVVTAPNTLVVTLVAPLLAAGATTAFAVRAFKINA